MGGLALVTNLSAEWGFYRTPAGKAVYFTLACAGVGRPGCRVSQRAAAARKVMGTSAGGW